MIPPALMTTAAAPASGGALGWSAPVPAQADYFNYIFIQGGLTSWLLLGLSLVLLTWVLVLLFSCRGQALCPPSLYSQLVDALGDGVPSAAARLVEDDPSVLARMVQGGLNADLAGESPDRVDAAATKAGADQFVRWSYRLGYLAVGAAIAPMLGLLGTVVGMIDAFSTLGLSDRITQQGPLAAAIGKALITTYEGLVIAIPTLIVYAVLRHRLGLIMLEAAARADALLGLWRQSRPASARPVAPAAPASSARAASPPRPV